MHQSRKGDFSEWLLCQDTCAALRKINLDIGDSDSLDFLSMRVKDNLTVDEKIEAVIQYYTIIYQNGKKMDNQKIFS